jgi:hypothetical protein
MDPPARKISKNKQTAKGVGVVTVFGAKENEMSVIGTGEAQDLEGANTKILQKISAEPAYRAVLYKILAYCDPTRSYIDVEQTILSFPEMTVALQSPQILLSWLVESGGIEQIATEDGEAMWCTTPDGRNVVRSESYGNRLVRLLAQETIYRDICLQVLQSCVSPKSRIEIESMLRGNPVLEDSKVYASFFIEALEEAGGLEWDQKWKTTKAGKDFLKNGK